MDPALVTGFALRVLAVFLLFASAVMLSRAWASGRLQETLGYGALRLARRSGMTIALLSGTICLGITGLISASMDLGVLPVDIAQAVGGVTFLAASLSAFALTWLGLSAAPPPPDSQLVLDVPEPYLAAAGAVDRASAKRTESTPSSGGGPRRAESRRFHYPPVRHALAPAIGR